MKWLLILLSTCAFTIHHDVLAQNSNSADNPRFWDRVYTGGNLGLQFGNQTLVDVSPLIGYMFTERLSFGRGFTYQYYRLNSIDYSTHIFGGRLFGRYLVIKNLFAHAEYELMNYEGITIDSSGIQSDPRRVDIHSMFIGGGFRQPIGMRSAFLIMVLVNLIDDDYSPYNNPLIRAGFTIGL